MRRVPTTERPDWKEKATELCFHFHTMHGEPYWDETSAYAFSLEEIETRIEDPATELHGMCLEAVETVIASDVLMARLCIPEPMREFVTASWKSRELGLYGRLDLAYDGQGPAKLLEYNADTPTALYEASSFQWLWLEDMLRLGHLPPMADQFNTLHEQLIERFGALAAAGETVHFTAVASSEEDFATVEYLAHVAKAAGLDPYFVPLGEIGLTDRGQFADADSLVIGTLFKLYPWEDILRDEFAAYLADSQCRFIEPAWKAVLSNKGILPVLWRLFEGHPNLLPAYFADEVERPSDRQQVVSRHVIKPVFSREGSSMSIAENGRTALDAADRRYDAHPKIVQALADLPCHDSCYPVLGVWIVGDSSAGLGIREDRSRITQNLSRFKPHFIDG